MKRYKKYEFCKAMDCNYHYPKNKFENENCSTPIDSFCPYTAKEFHKWLQQNLFVISAPENEYEASDL